MMTLQKGTALPRGWMVGTRESGTSTFHGSCPFGLNFVLRFVVQENPASTSIRGFAVPILFVYLPCGHSGSRRKIYSPNSPGLFSFHPFPWILYKEWKERKARVPEGLHPLLYSTIGEIEIFYTLMCIDFYFFVVFHQFQMANLIQLVILKVLKTLEGIKSSESLKHGAPPIDTLHEIATYNNKKDDDNMRNRLSSPLYFLFSSHPCPGSLIFLLFLPSTSWRLPGYRGNQR